MPTAIQALLTGLVDYAGLFPPAALGMDDAAREYAGHLASGDRWMLGRFVVPVARLGELATAAAPLLPLDEHHAWRIAALPGPDLTSAAQVIGEFNCRHAATGKGRAVIDTVEARATSTDEIVALLTASPSWLTTYVEVPLDDGLDRALDAIKAHGGRAKVRTGGVTPDAFPLPLTLARFLIACARRDLPFKATAGLHHPLSGTYRLTYETDPPHGTMFGFLNVFLAAALARQGAGAEDVAALLTDRGPASFSVSATGIAWRGYTLTTSDLDQLRARAAGFGSCSFREPTDELRTLGWL